MDLSQFSAGQFDRGASRLKEGLWVLVKCLFFLPGLPWPSAWRAFLLRCFGARIGRGLVIRSGAHITFPWRFSAGDNVWLGEDVLILSLAPVTLGDSVCLSQRAFLCTGSHAFDRTDFALVTQPVTIGSGSWIAAQAFVAPGVEIGPNVLVAAGSVVTRSVPAGSRVGGNPARPIPASGQAAALGR